MAVTPDDDEQQQETEEFERAFERPPPKRSTRAPAAEAEDEGDDAEAAAPEERREPSPDRDERGRFRRRGDDQEGEEDDGGDRGGREAIPAWRLREIAQERNQLREQMAAIQRERDQYAAQAAAYERQQRELQRQQSRPDFYSDPQGYTTWMEQERQMLREEMRAERRNERINDSFGTLREQDPERFDRAFATLCQAGEQGDPVFERVRNAPQPGRALMKWFGDLEVLHEIGGDIGSFRKKEAERLMADPEFRKTAMQAWRDQANGDDRGYRSGNVRNLPSINRVIGSGNQPGDDDRNDEDDFHRAFDPRPTTRRRRG